MSLKPTDLIGFMAGGIMIPDPISMNLGQSGVYWAKGGIGIPSNPNGDYGFEWIQESDDNTRVANSTLWSSFSPNPANDKYAGGRVPGIDLDQLVDYTFDGRNIRFTLFQSATIFVRVEGLVMRYFHSGSTHSLVNNAVGYALRVDGDVDMGTLLGGFSGQTDYGYYRFFDDGRGYAITNDAVMRVPKNRMNSNQTAVCVHTSTWQLGWDVGTPRIGDGQGDHSVYSPMAFCCTSTHQLTLPAGNHTIGVDIFCCANGPAVATYNGGAYSSVQSLAGGKLTISSVNLWGDSPGTGVITLTGTAYDVDSPYPYPAPPGTVFNHTESDAYNNSAVSAEIVSQTGAPAAPSGFASDQTTMNRVCSLIHGAGSEARNIGARGYNSPGNNTIVKYGTSWERLGARAYNSHLSGSFDCTDPTPIDPIIRYYGVWRQGANATITYSSPTGYFYPVFGGLGCEGGGGTGTGVPDGGGDGFLGGGSTGIGAGCFKAGTLITLANGKAKPIERIEIGDKILGARLGGSPRGHNQGRIEEWNDGFYGLEQLTVTAVKNAGRFYRHFLINGMLRATPEHPILCRRGSGTAFVAACDLKIGDELIAFDGMSVLVASVEVVLDHDHYFNFSVDGSHTYVANGIVVHNAPENNIVGLDAKKV